MVKDIFRECKQSKGIIFKDCSMAIMDGYETSENIRRFCSW